MMKRIFAILMAMLMLCSAALAEEGTMEAALADMLELVLAGDEEAFRVQLDDSIDAEDALLVFNIAKDYGPAESYELVDKAAQGKFIAGIFSVTHESGEYMYSIVLTSGGKIAGLNVSPAQAELTPTEVDGSIDFQARVQELLELLLCGDAEQFHAQMRADIATGVTLDQVQALSDLYGEAEMYALVYLTETQGYHQAVFEVKKRETIAEYQLTVDGSGKVVGLYADDKIAAEEIADADAWQQKGENYLNQLMGGEYEAVRGSMLEEMKQQLTDEVLDQMFAPQGPAESVQVYNLWQSGALTITDFVAQHAEQEMLYRLTMAADGTLVGLGYYPIVRIAPTDA